MKRYLLRTAFFIFAFGAVIFLRSGTAFAANSCVSANGGGNFSAPGSWSTCGGTTPQTVDTITITSSNPITLTAAVTVAGVNINSGASLVNAGFFITDNGTGTGANGLLINGTLSGSGGITMAGAGVTIDGNGTSSYTGFTAISANATMASTTNLSFGGTLTVATGTTLTQNGNVTFGGNATITGAVIDNGTFNASANLTGTGSWTQGANSTLICNGGGANAMAVTAVDFHTNAGNTVDYNAATQTLKATSYQNLTLSSAGSKTATGITTVSGNFIASAGTATVPFTTVGGVFTVSGGTITTSGNLTVTATTTVSSGSLTLGTSTFTESGNLAVSGGTFTTAAETSTILGTTEVSAGTLLNSNNTGPKTYTGLVTVDGGTLSGASTNIIFLGGINETSGSVAITGAAAFNTNNQTLSGTIAIATITVGTGVTVTNNAAVSSSGTSFTLTGNWTQGAGSSLTFSGSITFSISGTFNTTSNANTVSYIGGAETCYATQYYNLSFGGTSGKTCAPTSPILGNLSYASAGTWTLGGALTVNGSLTVATGTLSAGTTAFTVSGATTISGAAILSNPIGTGSKTYTGLITLNGGTLSGASTSTVIGAGIANNAGTVSLTGSSTVSTAGVIFSGANNIGLGGLTITSPGTVTNNGTTTLSGLLTGTGSWTQGSGSTLNLSLKTSPISSLTSFDAHTNPNTVNYNGATQTCLVTQYQSLGFGGTGTVTCIPTSPLLGSLTYGGSGTWTLGAALTIDGAMTINSGVVDVSTSNFALTVGGSFTNNGTFTTRSGTVTLNGTGQQSLSGTMTGSSAFYNLTITNNSGASSTDCELTGFVPGVIFLAGASSTNNFTITTGNVNVEYNNGSVYGFVNTDWVAPSGQPIYFRNSVAGSGTWSLNVSGTQTPLTYVNVSRSNASGGNAISASNITNRNCGNNTNWTFGSSSPSPVAYTQASYQWYGNQNSGTPGPELASPNTTTTLTSTGEAFRLRMLLAVDATSSVAGTDSFALQYANKGTGTSCTSTQFSYANITSSTPIAYNTNSLVANGSAMVPTSTDPTDGGRAVVEETYQSANNFLATTTISPGEDGNWDFSLKDNGGPGSTDYCFQAVFSSSTALYAYSVYPEIITNANPFPSVSNVLFNNGSTSITLLPDTTVAITVAASSTDPAGPGNISYATSTIYRTALGQNCTANNLDCYQIASSSCTWSGSTSTVTCSASLWYFAQSTGNASSSFPSDSWSGAITVTDAGGYATTATSTTQNVSVLTAINVTTSSINYGTLAASSTTGAVNQTTTVQNVGNSSTTLQLSGSAFVNGANFIATSSQHYATSSFTYGGAEQALSGTAAPVSGFLLTTPTTTTNVQSTIFWGDQIPAGTPAGTYTATTTFTAAFSQ